MHILVLAAGYSLYTLTIIFSIQYLSGINQLIPDIFADSTTVTIGKTFHQVMGSIIGLIITSMLLVRFHAKLFLLAFFIALIINIESYILLFTKDSFKKLSLNLESYMVSLFILNLLEPRWVYEKRHFRRRVFR
ncbi:MAG: hypothetical protein GY829_03105 [Gammaproteobacteria bacterium]|nr:hypothetical protein [Gammaproteobacteria bacterium]